MKPTSKTKPTAPATVPQATLTAFDGMPDTALIRLAELVRSEAKPDAPLPFAPATLWRRVKSGAFPKPMKLSGHMTCWRVCDVRTWLSAQGQGGAA